MLPVRLALAAAAAGLLSLPAAASCGSAFCLVNTDWSVLVSVGAMQLLWLVLGWLILLTVFGRATHRLVAHGG